MVRATNEIQSCINYQRKVKNKTIIILIKKVYYFSAISPEDVYLLI